VDEPQLRTPEYLPQSNSCTNRYNTANENELRHVQKQRRKIPQWPPLPKGAGRRTGGFLPLVGIFIRERKERKKESAVEGTGLKPALLCSRIEEFAHAAQTTADGSATRAERIYK
jgi:hypothetical protein